MPEEIAKFHYEETDLSLPKAFEVVPLSRIKIMFLHYPSVLLNLVLFVPSTRCFAVAELRARKNEKRRKTY